MSCIFPSRSHFSDLDDPRMKKQAAREAACMVGSVPNRQPTWATRLWASASAAVVGCAGN
jgi:hypothetical protein